jgi:pimeloyl-ACP methyl ester carboxylesterase
MMHLVPVAGSVLSSLALGQAEARPAVMIHGLLFGNMATWYTSLAAPMAATHRVMLYDQRGHGDSPVAAMGYDIAAQLADLRAVLAHHGFAGRPVDVVGHSMGAVIALEFALQFPSLVRRLVLIDASLPLARHVLPDLLSVTSPAVLDQYIQAHQLAHRNVHGRRLARAHRRLEQLFFHSSLVSDLRRTPETSDQAIKRLIPPTLLVYGRRSACLESGRRLQRLLPASRLELLDCGHFVVEEAPAALRQLVVPFLEGGE